MRILDSRRLTGANPWLDGPGAILDVSLEGLDPERVLPAWLRHAQRLLLAAEWMGATPVSRTHPGGASLAFRAPIDGLYAATEVNEAAWYAAVAEVGGDPGEVAGENLPDGAPYAPGPGGEPPAADEVIVAWLRDRIAAERRPALIALVQEAERRHVTLLADDDHVSIGLGTGSGTWPATDFPSVADVPWPTLTLHDIPVALVTGTNGKSTTVRLLGAMAAEAGITAGVTSTDRVTAGDEIVAVGDFSGPSGARTVLRDRRVEMAFLEVARGGILRRGLAVQHARAALVTNVANDHLGEYGIFDLPALADVKLVVARAVDDTGRVVLNADDPLLLERGPKLGRPLLWFSLDAAHPTLRAHVAAGGDAAWLEGDTLVLARAGRTHPIVRVGDIPIAFGGAARHNLANALGAIGVASALDLPIAAMARGLSAFQASPGMNPGRANVWELEGLRVIADYAHNPHGLRALAVMTRELPATRRGLVLGQAGDRSDDAIRELVREAWSMAPQRVFIKDMEIFLRGREPGAVPELIHRTLLELGATPDQLERHPTEADAVRAALAWARAGDLLLVTTHSERDRVIAWLEQLAHDHWRPGEPLDLAGTPE